MPQGPGPDNKLGGRHAGNCDIVSHFSFPIVFPVVDGKTNQIYKKKTCFIILVEKIMQFLQFVVMFFLLRRKCSNILFLFIEL